MLGETHKRIARRIALELRLNERDAAALENGSVSPEAFESFPHNKGKKFQIVENIVKSRIFFLERKVECFNYLGIALHFIQDQWALSSRTEREYTSWESQANLASILDDTMLEDTIKVLNLPSKMEEDYLFLMNMIRRGVEEFDKKEIQVKGKKVFEGLCSEIVLFALMEPSSSLSHPFLGLNFTYRICLEISKWVVKPVSWEINQAINQISMFTLEQTSLTSKMRGFPDSYLEKDWDAFRLEEIANVNEENLVELNNAFETWITYSAGALNYAVFPSYGNKIEDMQEKFRLTLKSEVREQRGAGFVNAHPLPDFRIDFSSFEQARYAEEAYFEIFPRQAQESLFLDRIGFIIENLLKTKFPADNELLVEILDEREKDIAKSKYLKTTIDDLKKAYAPSWNDVDNLKKHLSNIPVEYRLRLLAN
jgi:hypothetical protein